MTWHYSVGFSGSCISEAPASGQGCGSAGVVGVLVLVGIALVVVVAAAAAAAGLVAGNAAAAAATSAVVVADLRAGCACSEQRLNSASQIRRACRRDSVPHGRSAASHSSNCSVDCRSYAEVWQSSAPVMADRSTVIPQIVEQRQSSWDNTTREDSEASWSGP